MLAALICAAFVTAAEPVLTPLLRKTAVDVPSAGSPHSVLTPRGSDTPIAVGLALATLLLTHSKVAMTFAVAVVASAVLTVAERPGPAGRIHDVVRDLGYAPRSFADGICAEASAMGLAA